MYLLHFREDKYDGVKSLIEKKTREHAKGRGRKETPSLSLFYATLGCVILYSGVPKVINYLNFKGAWSIWSVFKKAKSVSVFPW